MSITNLQYEKISPLIGARILADKATLVSGVQAGQIRELLEECGVLVFPQINFTDEEQIAFTSTLGKFAKELRGEDVYKVSLDKGQNATAEYLKGPFFCNSAATMSPIPSPPWRRPRRGRAPEGGNTKFAN